MQRIFRFTAALVATFMLVFAAAPILASAQAGVTGATTYESPQFGYEVEWTEDWAVIDAFTTSLESSDQLRIFNEAIGVWVDIWGFDLNRTSESMLNAYLGLLEGSELYADVEMEELDATLPDTAVATFSYLFGENQTPLEETTEFRAIDSAFLVTSVKAAPDRSVLAAALVSTTITVDGDPIFPAVFEADEESTDDGESTDDEEGQSGEDEDDTSSQGGEGLVGNVYSSPNFGVALSFDEDVWEVNDETEAEDEDGRDVLILDNLEVPARLWLESYGTITRASDCIESASDEALPDDADFEPIEDEDGEELAGSSRGVAWAAYTYENEDGDLYSTYVECRALPEGAGVFVATLLTTPDEWDDAFVFTTELLETVNIEGGEPLGSSSSDDEDEPTEEAEEDEPTEEAEEDEPTEEAEEDEPTEEAEEDEGQQSAGAGAYESATWGFALTFDDSTWEVVRDRTRGEVDTLLLEAEGDLFLEVTSFELGRRDDAQSCAEDFVTDFDFEVDAAVDDDSGDRFSLIGTYLDDDDEEWSIVVSCQESPDGDFVVRFVGEGPLDNENDLLDAMEPVVDSIEFP